MARQPRRESRTKIYHLVNRGIDRKAIFGEKRERSRMLNIIREFYKKYQVNFYAYCIMPNHFHLLVQGELETLALFMAVISARYALYYNYKHQRTGYVFQNRYRSQCIEDESYFWNCLRYIHLNPIKAGLVRELVGYPYGSMKEFCTMNDEEDQILCADSYKKIKEHFGNSREFLAFHEQKCLELFIDEKEDELDQKVEAARIILEKFAANLNISLLEVIQYAELRAAYETRDLVFLKLSKKEMEHILDVAKKQLM